VRKTWLLDRNVVMLDLKLSLDRFSEALDRIESRMPGKWDRQISSGGRLYIYKRLA
jgi:hypothetical protein